MAIGVLAQGKKKTYPYWEGNTFYAQDPAEVEARAKNYTPPKPLNPAQQKELDALIAALKGSGGGRAPQSMGPMPAGPMPGGNMAMAMTNPPPMREGEMPQPNVGTGNFSRPPMMPTPPPGPVLREGEMPPRGGFPIGGRMPQSMGVLSGLGDQAMQPAGGPDEAAFEQARMDEATRNQANRVILGGGKISVPGQPVKPYSGFLGDEGKYTPPKAALSQKGLREGELSKEQLLKLKQMGLL